jgi:hypothetical protein
VRRSWRAIGWGSWSSRLTDLTWQLLADLVLVLHAGIVVFVVAGLLLIALGNWRRWDWVNALWFRVAHLAAIGTVALQAWFGIICPLTTLEMWLRSRAAQDTYAGSFVEYWVQRLLYFDLPPWVFVLAYSVFGLLVLAAWWYFPPRKRGSPGKT